MKQPVLHLSTYFLALLTTAQTIFTVDKCKCIQSTAFFVYFFLFTQHIYLFYLAGRKAMEEGTLRLSNLKADVGAELWLMQSSLDEVSNGTTSTYP